MLLKFCECGNILRINTVIGKFHCTTCLKQYDIKKEETLISTGQAHSDTYAKGKFIDIIRNAGLDPTNVIVKRECPDCGLDHMRRIFVGEDMHVVYKCPNGC